MSATSLVILASFVLSLISFYRLILYPLYRSPASKVPAAHWSASFSSIWILYHRVLQQSTLQVHEAHKRYGPIIRLAPNELSINCVEGGIRTIYAGGYEKGSWYSSIFQNFGLRPMFCMEDKQAHSKRKRMISNVYAKSTLQSSDALAAISKIVLHDRLFKILCSHAKQDEAFDVYDVFSATTMDMVAAYTVGLKNGSNLLGDLSHGSQLTRNFKHRQLYTVWAQELPVFTSIITKLGLRSLLIPPNLDRVNSDIEDWILEMCDRAEMTINSEDQAPSENYPTVYAQLRTSMMKDANKQELDIPTDQLNRWYRYEIASEIVDHIMAGFDTSSNTLTWLTWQLSKSSHAEWQQKLRFELLKIDDNMDLKIIDALPILDAILMETLRLHAAIPGNQPRLTPPDATLGPPGQVYAGIPANVRVQAQAWSLHRVPEVFPDPESWQPARWLQASEAQRKEMMRWFWAFGSGGRMCVGSNLAMYEMKAIVALIWSNFETRVVFDEGMTPNGGYDAAPLGKDGRILEVKFKRLS